MPADRPETTEAEPWPVMSESLRGGTYWIVQTPGVDIEIHEDDGGEALARRIAQLPVLEALHGKQS